MLRIISAALKLSWEYGNESSQFPDDMPIYEVIRQMGDFPFRLANTDMVSVILLPAGEAAQIVVRSEGDAGGYRDDIVPPMPISLDDELGMARTMAARLAQTATRQIAMDQEYQAG